MDKQEAPIANCPACIACVERHPWDGRGHKGTNLVSPIVCAFSPEGVFQVGGHNWNCSTLGTLRNQTDYTEHEVWNEDQLAVVLPAPNPCEFIVLCYYKHHGATDFAGLLDSSGVRPLQLSDLTKREMNEQ